MHTLGLHFSELFAGLQPPDDRKELAKELPANVRDFLKESADFETASPHSRLVGSYAQDLSVGDIKDVDLLVFVPGDPEEDDPTARAVISSLATTLKGLPEYLGYTGDANFDFSKNRRSVTVTFESEPFHLDVVPCIAPDGTDHPIWVPDRGYGTWIESHPLGVVALVTSLEADYPNKARNLIKLLKHFRNCQMIYKKPKSYWLLSMAIGAIQSGELDMDKTIGECFHQLVEYLYAKFYPTYCRTDGATPKIKDPMLGHNVSWNWERSHFETFMRRLDDGRGWAGRALETDDKEKAIELWRKVFGDLFPESVDTQAKSIATQLRPGAAAVTSAGILIPAGSAPKATPVRDTRFYGED